MVPASARRDLLVLCVLLGTSIVIAMPVLTDGWLTYLDNPPHMAELHSLASEGAGGWSSIAFAGLSLDTLHSPPLWHGLGWLADTGVLVPVYGALICLSIAAPAAAVYWVARRRIAWPWAVVLAYVVLVQRGAIVGSASASGGMFAFYLAAGAWIMLADRLARATTAAADRAAIAAWLAAIGLCHLYVLEAAIFLVAAHAGWALVTRRGSLRALVVRDGVACTVAAVASAAYWLPVAVGTPTFTHAQNLGPGLLGKLLVLPTDTIDLVSGASVASALPGYLESVPMVLLLAAGIAGIARVRRRDSDPLPAYGAVLAIGLLVLLVVANVIDTRALGPNSWRFLYFVRLAAALAAIAALSRLPVPRVRPAWLVVGALAIVASGRLWGAPLWADVPDRHGAEMDEVRELWRYLRDHPSGGRAYVQDTFMAAPLDRELSRSHVLALTLHESGVEAIGPYYAIIPSTTAPYLASEFGALFGGYDLRLPLSEWDVSMLVTSTPRDAHALAAAHWTELAQIGRFTVWRDPEPRPRVPAGAREGLSRLVFDLDGDRVVAAAYHAFWTVVAPAGARLSLGDHGRMAITHLPPGPQHVVLEYAPPKVWPVSVVGWLAILAIAGLGRRKRVTPAASPAEA
jgi:hypothetical protein